MLVVLIAIGLCISVVYGTWPVKGADPFPAVARRLHLELEDRVATVLAWEHGRKQAIEHLARDPRLVTGVREALKGEPVELDALLDRTCLAFEGCALYRTDGRLLGAFRVRETPDSIVVGAAQGRTTHSRVLATDDVGALTPPIDGARFSVFFATPLAVSDNDRVILVGRLRADESLDPLMRKERIGRTGESYVFDEAGFMVTRSRFDRAVRREGPAPIVLGRPTVVLRTPAARPTLALSAVRRGRTLGMDIDGYPDYRGVTVVGAWRWLDELGAGVVTEIDRVEALHATALR